MVALNKCGIAYPRLDTVGVDCALNKVVNLADFLSLCLENSDEFSAYYFALLLRLAYASKLA